MDPDRLSGCAGLATVLHAMGFAQAVLLYTYPAHYAKDMIVPKLIVKMPSSLTFFCMNHCSVVFGPEGRAYAYFSIAQPSLCLRSCQKKNREGAVYAAGMLLKRRRKLIEMQRIYALMKNRHGSKETEPNACPHPRFAPVHLCAVCFLLGTVGLAVVRRVVVLPLANITPPWGWMGACGYAAWSFHPGQHRRS